MVPRRAKKMSRHLSPFSAMASTFSIITSRLSYNSCALIGYCVNCVIVTFIVVMCVFEWTKRTHSEKQSRACTEVDLKWRMSVTSTQQTQLLIVTLKVTCDQGTNISNKDRVPYFLE